MSHATLSHTLGGCLSENQLFHLILKLGVDSLLMLYFLLVQLYLSCLDLKLPLKSVITLSTDFPHLTVLKHSLKLLNSVLQGGILFTQDCVLLPVGKQLSLNTVELVP